MANDELNDLNEVNFSMPTKDDLESLLQDTPIEENTSEEIDDIKFEGSKSDIDTFSDIDDDFGLDQTSDLSDSLDTNSPDIAPTIEETEKIDDIDDIDNIDNMNNMVNNPTQNPLASLSQENAKELPKLDNIVLPKSTKMDQEVKKNYLVAGAALLVLFITTIVVVRLITPKHENSQKSLVKNVEIKDEVVLDNSEIEKQYQSIVAKKLKIKNIDDSEDEDSYTKPAKVKKVSERQKPQKLQKSQKVKNSKILKELDEKPNLSLQKKLQKKKTKTIKPKKQNKIIKPTTVKDSKQSINRYYEPIKKVSKSRPVQKVERKEKKGMLFPSNKQQETKPTSGYSSRFKNSYSVPTTQYFIQVAAFSSKPPKATLAKIRKNHFRFKIYQTTIKGKQISKLLIGPYSSRGKELNSDLKIVKAKIVKGAFVFKSTSKR